ncbi:Epidermal growth factor-like protein 7 [Frankliniella fusca]|uniref:Epidermal growth factor-like protein 7 n=1 Tax=Frankliniella fusca TaxID=407009 RepID=A0AAE1LAE7_9NEOP|nr:Epidermal growth factor-like protein 7 [Frankliniella fusca]
MLPYQQRCNGDQVCRGVRMVCETAYREVVRTRMAARAAYSCCPGWGQAPGAAARRASVYGCDLPLSDLRAGVVGVAAVCQLSCEHGGTCQRLGGPGQRDTCLCAPGYTGPRCQAGGYIMHQDVDECDESAERRCDHICTNTQGSFRCECRPGFGLQPDGRSCQPLGTYRLQHTCSERRYGKPPGIAPDPTDGDFEFLAKKLAKLEQILLVRQRHELEEEAEDSEVELTSGAAAANAVAKLSARIDSLQTEIHHMRQAEHQRCAHMQERLGRLEDVCSRIALVERKVHHIAGRRHTISLTSMWLQQQKLKPGVALRRLILKEKTINV